MRDDSRLGSIASRLFWCQGRAGEIQDSILQNGYLDMLKLEVENNTQDVR